MKTPLALILSLCLFGISFVANAIPIFQLPADIYSLDIPKNGTGGGGGKANANNQASNFFRLEQVVDDNLLNLEELPTPVLAGAVDLGSNVVNAGGLIGFDYAVLHYGKGPGDIGQGGGVAFYYLNGASDATFPAIGTGPNGLGGFSSLTPPFKGTSSGTSVPDGGATVTLLGAALGLIAAARRKFRV
jgi:hypothetical protein